MSDLSRQYLRKTIEILETLATSQAEPLERAAAWVAEAIGSGHRVYLTKTSHTLHTEGYKRAGGLVAVHPLGAEIDFDQPMFPAELAATLRDGHWTPEPGDIAIAGSNAGTDAGTIEIALACQRLGCKVIALTQVAFEQSPLVVVDNPSGQKLHEIADLVIDLGGEVGDGVLPLPDRDYMICPTSGVAGVAAMWAIFAGAAAKMIATGKSPLIYQSAEVQGGMALFEQLNAEYERTGLGYRSGL